MVAEETNPVAVGIVDAALDPGPLGTVTRMPAQAPSQTLGASCY